MTKEQIKGAMKYHREIMLDINKTLLLLEDGRRVFGLEQHNIHEKLQSDLKRHKSKFRELKNDLDNERY